MPSATAALWARSLDKEGWSDAKIIGHLRAIGALYAFSEAKFRGNPIPSDELYSLVCDFGELRFRGSYLPDGTDSLELYWPRISISDVAEEIRAINRYSDFVSRYLSLPPLNPEENSLVKSARFYSSAREQGRWDAMVHLRGIRKGRPQRKYEISAARSRRRARSSNRPKYIAPAEMIDLVETGCRNARDKMLLLLMGYGGLRISEPLHLFLDDVSKQFVATKATKVRLEHPSHGFIRWHQRGKYREGQRAQFLSEMFARLPRNELGHGNPQFSGWKGMLLPDANPENRHLFWLEEATVGRYFRTLFEQYLYEHRVLLESGRLLHPYLFFNIRGTKSTGDYGAPLTIANAHDIFIRATKRAHLRYAPHSCRHHYAFYAADVLRLPQETLMRMLHHSVITSSDPYFARSAATVQSEIAGSTKEGGTVFSQKPIFPSHWKHS